MEKVTFEGGERTSYLDIRQPPISAANTVESSSFRPLGMISLVHLTPGAQPDMGAERQGRLLS